MAWTPPPRAAWVDDLAAFGRGLGDDGRSMVSLDHHDLLAAATQATGLSDFGDDWFRQPLEHLCAALDGEAQLHLAGRIRARAELQLVLQNRLRLVDLWRRQPGIATQPVTAPIIVTGLGRSGTTLLHELLACDPDNRAPRLWEFTDSVPPTNAAERVDDHNPRATLSDQQVVVMNEMVPAFTTMHDNRGFLPTECIFAFAHQFSSDMFTGLYNVGSYTIWRSSIDQSPIYDWHRRMLQTWQWGSATERFVLKAPSHLSSLDLVFATYPDARVVITHRDPLRVVGSLSDLMATLHWMHSDHVDHEILVMFLSMGLELQMNEVMVQRDSGILPTDQIRDVVYGDLVADPIRVVTELYASWDLPVSPAFHGALATYIEARHAHRGPSDHDYSFEDTGLELAEHRPLVAEYQARYRVPSEVE
jgi:Sulfotransferase family